MDKPQATHRECVERFLETKRQQVGVCLSVGRFDNLRRELRIVSEVCPESAGFGADHLAAIVSAVHVRVQRHEISLTYARGQLASVRQLVTWAYQRELIPILPRSISMLSLQPAPIKIATWTAEQLQTAVGAAGPRLRCCLLLMANCGFTSADCANLLPEEVNREAGTISRRRTKTRRCATVPCVTYHLWNSTRYWLERCGRWTPGLAVLQTRLCQPLAKRELSERGGVLRTDPVGQQFRRLRRQNHAEWPDLKAIRATSASTLAAGPYAQWVSYFLGHSPRTVADRHYVAPLQDSFDSAVKWLGKTLGIDEDISRR